MEKPKYRKFFFNLRGQLIKKICEESGGVSIRFPPAPNSSKVTLIGARNFANRAKLAIKETLTDLDSQVVVQCIVPPKYHVLLKGPKGVNLQQLSEEHNVLIDFPRREVNSGESSETGTGRPGDVIEITGKEESCQVVEQALLDLVPRDRAVIVPCRFHGAIVGRLGQNVTDMRQQYGVRIKVPPAKRKRGYVLVRGPLNNCVKVQEALLKLVEELQPAETNEELPSQGEAVQVPPEHQLSHDEMVVEVPLRFHRAVMGERSENIRSLCDQFNVWIFIPRPDLEKDYFRVQGPVSNRERAKEALRKRVEELLHEEKVKKP